MILQNQKVILKFYCVLLGSHRSCQEKPYTNPRFVWGFSYIIQNYNTKHIKIVLKNTRDYVRKLNALQKISFFLSLRCIELHLFCSKVKVKDVAEKLKRNLAIYKQTNNSWIVVLQYYFVRDIKWNEIISRAKAENSQSADMNTVRKIITVFPWW